MMEFKHLDNKAPPVGTFISAAPAFLVAMLKLTEAQSLQDNNSPDEAILIPEVILKKETAKMCQEKFNHIPNAFCLATWRLTVLCNRGFIKKRSLGKEPVYQLLDLGEEEAVRLRAERLPTRDMGAHKEGDQEQPTALYTNDSGADGLILLVDTQEWGGDHRGLGQLIDLIKHTGMTYCTKKLLCGDYSWLMRCAGEERIMPLLVERKRADDLSKSLVDGRYGKQREKMVKWKEVFMSRGIPAVLKYIIEAKPEQFVVKCADGCGGVGKCGYPSALQLKKAIEDLEKCPDFDVLKTDNIDNTVEMLALLTAELQHRVDKGDFDDLIVKDIDPDKLMTKLSNATCTVSTEAVVTGTKNRKTNDGMSFKERRSDAVFPVEPKFAHWADELLADENDDAVIPLGSKLSGSADKNGDRYNTRDIMMMDDNQEEKSGLMTGTSCSTKSYPYVKKILKMKGKDTNMNDDYGQQMTRIKQNAYSRRNTVINNNNNNGRTKVEKCKNYYDHNFDEDEAPIQLAQYHATPGTSVNVPLVKTPKPSQAIHIQAGVLPTVIGRYVPGNDDTNKNHETTQEKTVDPITPGTSRYTGYNRVRQETVASAALGSPSTRLNNSGSPRKRLYSKDLVDEDTEHLGIHGDIKQIKPSTSVARTLSPTYTSDSRAHTPTSLSGVLRRVPKPKKGVYFNQQETKVDADFDPEESLPSTSTSASSTKAGAKIYLMKTPTKKSGAVSSKLSGSPVKRGQDVSSKRDIFSDLSDEDSLPDLTRPTVHRSARNRVEYSKSAVGNDDSDSITGKFNLDTTASEFRKSCLGEINSNSITRKFDREKDCHISVAQNSAALQGDFDSKVDTVLGILPHVKRERVISALIDNNSEVERCVSVLLDEDCSQGSVMDLTEMSQ